MGLRYGVISAVDQVQETPDVWTTRLPKRKWGSRIPHLVQRPDGSERWSIDGLLRDDRALAWTGALSKNRFEEPQSWSAVPKAAYDPDARMAAMNADSIDAQVLYPSAAGFSGEAFLQIQDKPFELACVRAYNDWMADIWGQHPTRFVPQALVPMYSPEIAAAEVTRAVSLGHRGVVMAPIPWHLNPDLPHINNRVWDPLWHTVEDAGIPLCWRSGSDPTIMLEIYDQFNPAMTRAFDSIRRPVSSAVILANFLLSGIPERFPDLRVIFASTSIGWVPFQLENSDHEWDRAMLYKEGMDIKPSEIFHRQCSVTTWADRAALETQIPFIGAANILWESEFPMETSTYPHSAETVARHFAGVPQAERDHILYENTAQLYRIQV